MSPFFPVCTLLTLENILFLEFIQMEKNLSEHEPSYQIRICVIPYIV